MEQITVAKTVDSGLCTSCGVCKGICPKDCIRWRKQDGLYVPQINTEKCIHCGLCSAVCPGLGHTYHESGAVSAATGNVLACYNAWSRDPQLRHISASGGVVSTMVRALLAAKLYDSVFCLDTYDYHGLLTTKHFTAENYLNDQNKIKTPKSRYLPVSHENALCYMRSNRKERIIIVATSCALRGIAAAIRKLNLNRENYLFIGLFCDKIFNYNVISYFEDYFCQGNALTALHFKNKESGGWPGNMKFYPASGEPFYQPKAEREKAKAYFMPERCLYCVDKLNVQADISLGDNYTEMNSTEFGSNSVVLRTQRGIDAWNAALDCMEAVSVDIDDIQKAQYLEGRLNNLYFGDLKAAQIGTGFDLNQGIQRERNCTEFNRAWKENLRRLRTGQSYVENPERLKQQMQKDSKKINPVISFCKRGYYFLKRKLSGGNQ